MSITSKATGFCVIYKVKIMNFTEKQTEELLERGVSGIIKKESTIAKLKSGKKLRIKHGIDPTAPDLHIGHCVNYFKLRQFQKLGHTIIFLIGDFTALIGDPTEKSETRPLLSKDVIEKNTQSILSQVGKILDLGKTEIKRNSQWYNRMKLEDFLNLASKITHQQLIERDMFQERIKGSKPVFMHEILYPILQAYDSVVLKSDLTVIGTDQLFNEMQARILQQYFGQEPQDIITVPLLIGTDGVNKMSQSLGNYIGIKDSPNEMYAKIMSIPDNAIIDYFTLLTVVPLVKIRQIEKELVTFRKNPLKIKKELAAEIVTIFYDNQASDQAKNHFEHVFQNRQLPKDAAKFQLGRRSSNLVDLLCDSGLTSSRQEAKRLIKQRSVEVDGQVISDTKKIIDLSDSAIVRVGKKTFLKITA